VRYSSASWSMSYDISKVCKFRNQVDKYHVLNCFYIPPLDLRDLLDPLDERAGRQAISFQMYVNLEVGLINVIRSITFTYLLWIFGIFLILWMRELVDELYYFKCM